jgi:hypothetical protein
MKSSYSEVVTFFIICSIHNWWRGIEGVMHQLSISIRYCPSHIFISGKKGFGDSRYDFFNHIQELGFKGLGFRV